MKEKLAPKITSKLPEVGSKVLQKTELSVLDLSEALGISGEKIREKLSNLSSDKMGSSKSKSFMSAQECRKLLAASGFKYPQQIISFQMLKGGVAKTTSALNLGLRAAQYGARILFVDLDQQANLSFALGVENEDLPVWVDIVEKKSSVESATVAIAEGVDLIPSSLNNSVLDRVLLNSHRNWSQSVLGPLKEVKAFYDFIIIDTAPHLSVANSAVTCASDRIILPINPDKFSLLGLRKHREDLLDLKNEFSLRFSENILLTRFDAREKVSHEVKSFCEKHYRDLLLESFIRTSTEIKNTIHQGKNLFANKSVAKEDYDRLTREILGLRSVKSFRKKERELEHG